MKFEDLNTKIETVMEGVETENMPFVKIKELTNTTIRVQGFFFTDSKMGKQVVVVGDNKKINMPKRAVEQFEKIKETPELLTQVLQGKLILKVQGAIKTKQGDSTAYKLETAF